MKLKDGSTFKMSDYKMSDKNKKNLKLLVKQNKKFLEKLKKFAHKK